MTTTDVVCPLYMLPVEELLRPVEVLTEPEIVKVRGSDEIKRPRAFPGRTGFRFQVEFVRGIKRKKLPTGKDFEGLDLAQVPVTVWLVGNPPALTVGGWAQLEGLMVGGSDAGVYVQALGVKPVSS